MDGSHSISSPNVFQQSPNCKLVLSRGFLRIIGGLFSTLKSNLLIICTYLLPFGEMTKRVWAVFKASRGNTSVERVMCSQQVHQVNQAYADCTNLEQGVDGSSLMRKLRKKEKNVFVPLFVQTGCFLLQSSQLSTTTVDPILHCPFSGKVERTMSKTKLMTR